jgi:hypothetical protein
MLNVLRRIDIAHAATAQDTFDEVGAKRLTRPETGPIVDFCGSAAVDIAQWTAAMRIFGRRLEQT